MDDTPLRGDNPPGMWRLPEGTDPGLVKMLFEVSFGTPEQRATNGGYRPFYELPQAAVDCMPPALLDDYNAAVIHARDHRSGQTFISLEEQDRS